MHKSWSLNTHKYTHTANFNCIQISMLCFHIYGIEHRCTVQSCQSCCVLYKVHLYAILYESICNTGFQTQLKFTVYTPVQQQSHMEGKSLASMLCTQALPCLTFHCRTVEMGDKVTHSQSHTHLHTVVHTLTCTIDKVCVHSHLKKCASGRGTEVSTSTHHAHALTQVKPAVRL